MNKSMNKNIFSLLLLLCSVFLSLASGSACAADGETVSVFDAAKNKWVTRALSGGEPALPQAPSATSASGARQVVEYPNDYRKGTIVVDTAQRRLFRVLDEGHAMRYTIGVGREGFAWKGTQAISRMDLWPSWTPPSEMREREAAAGRILPARMEGGPDNPLGARALYLGNTLYRIHGTNQPASVGRADSSGCIRMTNEDVVHLFENTRLGTSVIVR